MRISYCLRERLVSVRHWLQGQWTKYKCVDSGTSTKRRVWLQSILQESAHFRISANHSYTIWTRQISLRSTLLVSSSGDKCLSVCGAARAICRKGSLRAWKRLVQRYLHKSKLILFKPYKNKHYGGVFYHENTTQFKCTEQIELSNSLSCLLETISCLKRTHKYFVPMHKPDILNAKYTPPPPVVLLFQKFAARQDKNLRAPLKRTCTPHSIA